MLDLHFGGGVFTAFTNRVVSILILNCLASAWVADRLQEKPLEVGGSVPLLFCLLRASNRGIAAMQRTVASFAEPAAPIGDKTNTAGAIWI
jgi:hypothetical protein